MVFESNGQSMSKLCWSILIGTGTVSAAYALVIATGLVDGKFHTIFWKFDGIRRLNSGLNWLDLLIFGSYIKIGSSCIKYMPQVYLNWKRKCTLGFAIDKGNLKIITSRPPKIGQKFLPFLKVDDLDTEFSNLNSNSWLQRWNSMLFANYYPIL